MAVCNTLPFAARKDTFCRLKGDVLQGKSIHTYKLFYLKFRISAKYIDTF